MTEFNLLDFMNQMNIYPTRKPKYVVMNAMWVFEFLVWTEEGGSTPQRFRSSEMGGVQKAFEAASKIAGEKTPLRQVILVAEGGEQYGRQASASGVKYNNGSYSETDDFSDFMASLQKASTSFAPDTLGWILVQNRPTSTFDPDDENTHVDRNSWIPQVKDGEEERRVASVVPHIVAVAATREELDEYISANEIENVAEFPEGGVARAPKFWLGVGMSQVDWVAEVKLRAQQVKDGEPKPKVWKEFLSDCYGAYDDDGVVLEALKAAVNSMLDD